MSFYITTKMEQSDKMRAYRQQVKSEDLVIFEVKVKETDLLISAQRGLKKEAEESVKRYRAQLEDYIKEDPLFETTLSPCQIRKGCPRIVEVMAEAASVAKVGPMAAVAGAMAELVGRDLLNWSEEIIVENGGDIFLKVLKERQVGIFAGSSPLSSKISLKINPLDTPLGICTSSGTVGHSLSLGRADAVTVVSPSTALADALATRIGNIIKTKEDIPQGLNLAQKIKGVKGVVIIKEEKMGIWGDLKLSPCPD
ncbi:MAG: hypothetical protein COS84_05265 [Armatimonadetes bacterium CG07_land_8_20_14_0_80_40_9]|nr:MAG: hypothetical protein COS84_05265 [Armatimonadetes bacterium CG07_land_8_20_14_0_80_40_9]